MGLWGGLVYGNIFLSGRTRQEVILLPEFQQLVSLCVDVQTSEESIPAIQKRIQMCRFLLYRRSVVAKTVDRGERYVVGGNYRKSKMNKRKETKVREMSLI